MIDTEPLLSVVVLAYNHEKYIRQALDSILMNQFASVIYMDLSSNRRLPDVQYIFLWPEDSGHFQIDFTFFVSLQTGP